MLLYRGVITFPAASGNGFWNGDGAIADTYGAWLAKEAASYAASLLDLSGETNDLLEGNGAITWSAASGWQFAAADSKFLYAPGVTFTGGDYTIIIQFAAETGGGQICGVNDTSAGYSLIITPSKFGNRVRYNFGSTTNKTPELAAGNLAIAGTSVYRNGVNEGGITKEDVSTTAPFGIGAVTRNSTPSGDSYVSAHIYSVVVNRSILDDADVATIATDMAALAAL